ncbi:MAG TPA: hypothetical protein VF329_00115 [Gammaproteobacteria bacterium]
MARAITQQDEQEYSKRLLKNIPSEIIGVYLALNGMLAANAQTPNWVYWVIFGVLLVLCPVWLRYGQDVKQGWQLIITTIAFVIWAMTTPGAFDVVPYSATIGGALVIIYTGIIAPIVSKRAPKKA